MSDERPAVKEGEWVQPVRRGYRMECCDCGLVHRLNFHLVKTRGGTFIKFQAFRDEPATAAARKARPAR